MRVCLDGGMPKQITKIHADDYIIFPDGRVVIVTSDDCQLQFKVIENASVKENSQITEDKIIEETGVSVIRMTEGTPLSADDLKFKRGNKISINALKNEFGKYKSVTAYYSPNTGITTLIVDWGGQWNDLILDDLVIGIDYPSSLSFHEARDEDWSELDDNGELKLINLTEKDKNTLGEVTGFLWARKSIQNSRGIKIGMTAEDVCSIYSDGVYLEGRFGYGDSDDYWRFLGLHYSLMIHASNFDSVLRVNTADSGKIGYDIRCGEVWPNTTDSCEYASFYFKEGRLIAMSEGLY